MTNKTIQVINIDISSEQQNLEDLFRTIKPHAIYHFAEQRSAPYSMRSKRSSRFTVRNNVCGTHNVLTCIHAACPEAHLIHVGSMGGYGYGDAQGGIAEGYIDDSNTPCQCHPGSVYHMTKVIDAEMFRFYAKFYNIRIL